MNPQTCPSTDRCFADITPGPLCPHRCKKCYSYVNGYCAFDERAWHCALCSTQNNYRAHLDSRWGRCRCCCSMTHTVARALLPCWVLEQPR
jgi:hypothetical protein